MSKVKYTKELLEPIVQKSFHWAEVCRALGIAPFSGSQTHLKKRVLGFGIDISHFRGKVWNKGTSLPPKRPIEDYLSGNRFINSHNLKKRLIREGLKEERCEACGTSEWQGEQVVVELDHKDNNHLNNSLDNLVVLCPNCHALKTRKERAKRKKPR